MTLRRLTALVLAAASAFALVGLGCGNKPEPMTPSLSDPAGAALSPTAPAGSGPAAAADPPDEGAAGSPAEHHRGRKPFSIHSSCTEVTTIVFGEDPKAPGAGRRTVASNSSIDGPRDAEGKQTVWLLDAKGEPLVKVHVTRGMKQLEIGRSCRTLDAR